MTDFISRLQMQLKQVQRIVDDPRFSSQTDGAALHEETVSLLERISLAEQVPLTVGLLGGTGVGKSTILNTLAGSEIAAADHRRPRTDQVLIYRRKDTKALPEKRLKSIPWQEHIHENDTVGKMILCDLPDFDSIEEVHRQRVLAFLEHLDLLIWVTSPEKYADRTFHDFLAAVPKSQRNFYFVMNKVDLLFSQGASEKGYEETATLSETFQNHLRENGVAEPLIFLVSARTVSAGLPSEPWNQFTAFKNQVFQERRLKEVMAIKAANLDVEVQALLGRIRDGIQHLDTFDGVLEQTGVYIESQREAWAREWTRTTQGWAESPVRDKMQHQRPDPIPLLGPGYTISAFMDRIKTGGKGAGEESLDKSTDISLENVCATFDRQLASVATRLESQCLHHGMPKWFEDEAKKVLQRSTRVENLRSVVSQSLAWHMGRAPWPSFLGFKIWQRFCYTLILVVFILAIGGQTPWGNVIDAFDLNTLGHLVLATIHTIFSGKGIAALGSYIVLNTFLGFRFYRRFTTLAGKLVDERVAELRKSLVGAWEKELDALYGALQEARKEIQKEKETIVSLTESDA